MNILKKYKENRMLKQIESDVESELSKMDLLIVDENGNKCYKMGTINIKWAIQKRLLKEKFNYNWESPQDKNPNINYD